MVLLILCTLSYFIQSLAQLIGNGPCPPPVAVPAADFNFEKAFTTWYEVARIDNLYEYGQKCGKFIFAKENGSLVERYESIVEVSGGEFSWSGTITPVQGVSPGRFTLIFPKYAAQKEAMVTFVAGDWDHWAVLYGCQVLDGATLQYMSVLSKTAKLDKKYMGDIDKVLEKLEIPVDKVVSVDHKNCPNNKL